MSNWQTRLAQRRARFLARSHEKLENILQLIAHLEAQPGDTNCLDHINRIFHQLAGAGGIYELVEICDLAIAAETLCSRLIIDGQLPSTASLHKLKTLASALSQSIDQASHGLSKSRY